MITSYKCIVVANGLFPSKPLLLHQLRQAEMVIACDGATLPLHQMDIMPDAIIGDMDSLPHDLAGLYKDRIHTDHDQETNDLTKAVSFARNQGVGELLILGATGLREDHTLGNISLLMDYANDFTRVEMASDFGLFTPILHTTAFACRPGQQVSFFSLQPGALVTTHELRYPLYDKDLTSWWQGTLNETIGAEFTLELSPGSKMIVFREWE